jgi:UDP-glucose 4-epimerase
MFQGDPVTVDDELLDGFLALGADIDPEYIECPFDGYIYDTMADYNNFHETTGWEPQITVEEGVELVCKPYLDDESV